MSNQHSIICQWETELVSSLNGCCHEVRRSRLGSITFPCAVYLVWMDCPVVSVQTHSVEPQGAPNSSVLAKRHSLKMLITVAVIMQSAGKHSDPPVKHHRKGWVCCCPCDQEASQPAVVAALVSQSLIREDGHAEFGTIYFDRFYIWQSTTRHPPPVEA